MAVEDQLLAVGRIDRDQDAPRQHAIKTVARVAAAEHDVAPSNMLDDRGLEELACFLLGQDAEKRVQAEQVLRGHPGTSPCDNYRETRREKAACKM